MTGRLKRGLISIALFLIVFFLGGPLTNSTNYDATLQAIFYLSGIIAAGCYWVGSRPGE